MDSIQPIRTTDGGERVDVDQGCSACGGDCPCPQACERREEARQAQRAPWPASIVRRMLAPWSRP